jgi:DNA-directed RNA polymerase subunit RPC12/RpoP
MSYTVSLVRCPHCNKTIDFNVKTGSPSTSMLGEQVVYTCKHCGKIITNGKKEWPSMTEGEKTFEIIRFSFLTLVRGIIIGGILASLIFGLGLNMIESNFESFIAMTILTIVFVSALIAKTFYNNIKMSNDRFRSNNSTNNDNKVDINLSCKDLTKNTDINSLLAKIIEIDKKINKIMIGFKMLNENNTLLKKEFNSIEMKVTINKNDDIITYLNTLYDRYVSISIELYYNGLIYYLLNEDIKKISIKDKILELENDTYEYIHKYFPKDKTNEELVELWDHTGSIIKVIKNNVNDIKLKLINIQNKIIISSFSPIEIESEIKEMTVDNDFERIENSLDKLNLEYDKFFSEYEVINTL